jgi:23S rRNA (cytidine1920-2'-O)/16S rRNA (cytidine1409-2'-O)-methyltransferase
MRSEKPMPDFKPEPMKQKKPPKMRLDALLVEQGLAPTPEKARALILSGAVLLNATRMDKAGALVAADATVTVKGEDSPFVSRGGLKLQGALDAFALEVAGLVALDVGASTGGFTDCLLQAGAKKVYAVDVGYGQLAWKLREDPRVVVRERTNIRHYDGADLAEKPDLAVIDVSFISLKTVLPAVLPLLTEDGRILALIKPQFEAAREEVGKNGVVEDDAVHERVIEEIRSFFVAANLAVAGTCASVLRGPAGNREFFILAQKTRKDGN